MKCEIKEALARLRSFVIEPRRSPLGPDGHHPAFTYLVRPLLGIASEAFAWPPSREPASRWHPKGHDPNEWPKNYPVDILKAERGKYRFDLTTNVTAGYESFWHHDRGSIVVRTPAILKSIDSVFRECVDVFILASKYQLAKGESSGAIRYCNGVVDDGHFAFMFSTSGLQYVSLFGPDTELEKLYRLARSLITECEGKR